MRILVHQLSGKVQISFYGKCGYHMHTEEIMGGVSGKNGPYERVIPCIDLGNVQRHTSKAVSAEAFIRYELQP